MNMSVKTQYFKNPKNRELSELELDALAAELDAIRQEVLDDLGEKDATYIKRVYSTIQYSSALGRACLFAGWFPPAWILGTGLLGFAKIMENMELGHNVMHGQYDWMNDPRFEGSSYEWDTVGTSDNWRETHNYKHHTYTNIKGMDDDIGYGLVRLFPEQRWKTGYLFQPLYSIPFCLLFQWGVAIQNLEIGKLLIGKKTGKQMYQDWKPVQRKVGKQLFKDYVFFPLIAGPAALPVFTGNLVANGLRNIWTFSIIFCGHFTKDVEVFPRSVLKNESRGHWYMRQIRGSSNLSGSEFFHILTGHLSHQIEHHLFPEIPARRYRAMAPKVEAVCEKYGLNYNNASLFKQYGQVLGRIVKYALPGSGAESFKPQVKRADSNTGTVAGAASATKTATAAKRPKPSKLKTIMLLSKLAIAQAKQKKLKKRKAQG